MSLPLDGARVNGRKVPALVTQGPLAKDELKARFYAAAKANERRLCKASAAPRLVIQRRNDRHAQLKWQN